VFRSRTLTDQAEDRDGVDPYNLCVHQHVYLMRNTKSKPALREQRGLSTLIRACNVMSESLLHVVSLAFIVITKIRGVDSCTDKLCKIPTHTSTAMVGSPQSAETNLDKNRDSLQKKRQSAETTNVNVNS
jgi:hypothetical protein